MNLKRILLVLGLMICSAQMVFAYSFSNAHVQAEVSASGQIKALTVDGMVAPLSGVVEAAVSWEGGTAVCVNAMTADPSTIGANIVSTTFKIKNVKRPNDTLVVNVTTKLVGNNKYLDQRYKVTYWEYPAGTQPLTLNDVRIFLYVGGHADAKVLLYEPFQPPITSAWPQTSAWPNPVDTAFIGGKLQVGAYVPNKTDDHQTGMPADIRAAIESGNLQRA